MRWPHVAQPVVVYKPNEIPSESSFEFSLGLCPKSSSPIRTLPTSAHKSLGYYAPLYGFSVFGLRVISLMNLVDTMFEDHNMEIDNTVLPPDTSAEADDKSIYEEGDEFSDLTNEFTGW